MAQPQSDEQPLSPPHAETAADPPDDQPTVVQQPADIQQPADVPEPTDDPPTQVVPSRWTGSAAVPASGAGRRRRWFPGTTPAAEPSPVREPTLELPVAERAALEGLPPVDPWAGADPWPGAPGATCPPTAVGPSVLPGPTPAPGPPAAPPPVGPARKRRGRAADHPLRYGPPPPGWRPPPGYVVVAVRRRRRWPWVLLALALVGVVCCCGVPMYVGKPMWDQYPVSATLPDRVADLRLRTDTESRQATQALERRLREAHLLAESTFAGIYTAPSGKRVTVFGVTGFRWSPDSAVDDEITRLTPDYKLTGPRAFETGIRGEYLSCATGRADGEAIVACTWADHGSLGTALFTRLSVEDSVRLLTELRGAIIGRG